MTIPVENVHAKSMLLATNVLSVLLNTMVSLAVKHVNVIQQVPKIIFAMLRMDNVSAMLKLLEESTVKNVQQDTLDILNVTVRI